MGKKGSLIDYRDTEEQITFVVKRPSMRYLNEFLGLKCAPDLVAWGLYPNVKEISESAAAYAAVRRELGEDRLKDPDVVVYCVGDGSTPRTATMFAVRSAWHSVSIDPALNPQSDWEGKLKRLRCYEMKVEEFHQFYGESMLTTKVVVAVHSHAKLEECEKLRPSLVVAVPCCVPQTYQGRPPDKEYEDWGILSPERTVKAWRCGT